MSVNTNSVVNGGESSVSGIGIIFPPSGGDDTTKLQQAADDLYSTALAAKGEYNTGFYIRLIDREEYNLSSITMPPGMTLTSASGIAVPFSDRTGLSSGAIPVSTGPVVRHITKSAPMLRNDQTRGIIRSGTTRFGMLTVAGLTMVSDRFSSGGRGDAPFIDFDDVFGCNILGNLQITSTGFGMKLLTCNGFSVKDNISIFAPWFLYHVVDSIFTNNNVGGGNGYASDAVWMSGDVDNDLVCRLGLYTSNLFYNNNGNGLAVSTFAQTPTITGISGDTITLNRRVDAGGDGLVDWRGETPVMFQAGGTLPTATGHTITLTKTYWVTVQAGGLTIKLSTTRANRLNNIFLSFSAAGSGNALRVGGNANLNITSGARDNQFVGMRLDQAYGDNLVMNGAPGNMILGLETIYAHCGDGSYVAPVAGPAITLQNGSINNTIAGVANGLQHGAVGAGPSLQKFAISVDSTSRAGLDIAHLKCINHTPANSEAGAQAYQQPEINPRQIVLFPSDFTLAGGSGASLSNGLNSTRISLAMANTVTAFGTIRIPHSWSSVRCRLLWANATTTAGAANFSVRLGAFEVNANAGGTEALFIAAPNVTLAAGGEPNILKEGVIEFGDSTSLIGRYCSVRVVRTDGTGPTVQLLQVVFEEAV